MKKKLIALILLVTVFGIARANETKHLFVTGKKMEVDRCASAWLIKRFVDPEAIFRFVIDGTLIKEGVAFDTPDALLRRTHNQSTFESILSQHRISDSRIRRMAELIHDIEVNFWGKKKNVASYEMEKAVLKIIKNSKNIQDCLSRCFQYFDNFIQEMNGGEKDEL